VLNPLTEEEFKRMALTFGMLAAGAMISVLLLGLGATLTDHPMRDTGLTRPLGECNARYLGEIAYWAEAPDNTMICQRMDRNSMRERKCADASVERPVFRQ
jgi:hypothetical protein